MIKRENSENPAFGFDPKKSLVAELKGLASGYVLMIICFAVLALVYTYTSVPAGIIKPAVVTITAISIIVGAALAAIGAGSFGWIHGAVLGVLYCIIRIIAGVVFAGGGNSAQSIIAMLLFAIFMGAFGGILGINVAKA